MLAKELRLDLRIKNNRLIVERESRGMTREEVASAAGVGCQALAALETMSLSPINASDEWRKPVLKLAAYYGKPVEELFPGAVLAVAVSRRVVEVDGASVARLMSPERIAALPAETDTATDVERAELSCLAREDLLALTPQQRRAVTLRFGLSGDEPMTLRETGAAIGVGTERARQLVMESIRRLRHAMFVRGAMTKRERDEAYP